MDLQITADLDIYLNIFITTIFKEKKFLWIYFRCLNVGY